ncbi:MAG: Crp/Fnr family transcriptional regulator [Ferruginibacter sp.]
MSSLLVNYLNSVSPLSNALKEKLYSIIQIKEFSKKEIILSEGQVSNYIYFIEKGFIRSYCIKEGKEITAWFMADNDFIISVNSFFKRAKSYEFIETIEDSIVHFVHYDELEKLYKEFLEFNVVGRILTTHYYVLSEERLYNMRKQTAEERYYFLIEKHPQVFQRAPLSQIASYLGMSFETLSRVRAKK